MDELKKILSSEVGADIVRELGIEDVDAATQASLIEQVAATILERVTLEVFKKLPIEVQSRVDELFQTGRIQEARELIGTHIPELGDFVRKESAKVLARIKAQAAGSLVE